MKQQMNNKTKEEINKEISEKLDNELETIESVCFEYKKNKSFISQILFSLLGGLILYCQQYVLKNNIDIGLSNFMLNYIGIATIVGILFGWIGYYLEFYISNFNIFKICKTIIWIIEIIMIVVFVFLLFFN